MVTTKTLYCLPVVRQGDRFKADRESTLAFSDLLEYSHLKQLLAESFRAHDAVVEIEGVAHVARVFEPCSGDDCSYALVESGGTPPSPSSLLQLLGKVVRTYFSALRRKLSFSDSFPPSHKSYLLTEFIEPKFTVLEGWSDRYKTLTWKDARGLTRAIIQGEPGIGKTTFLRRWALEETNKVGTEKDGRFPIYLQLRDLTDPSTMWEVALKSIVELGRDVEPKAILRSGRVVLLLDGLDELPPRGRSTLLQQITAFSSDWPTVGCLLTSRSSTAPPSLPGFARIQIEPLDQPRQDEWIRRRVRRVGHNAETDLLTMLRSSKPMAALAGNPLLLSIAAAFVERTGLAPTRPSALVTRYIDGLLEDWDEAKGIVRWGSIPLSKQRKVEILCRAAFNTCRLNRTSFERNDFLRWEHDWSDRDKSIRSLSLLWEHSGIIQPASDNESVWRFAHSVIADVLAARYIVERPDNLLVSAAKEIEGERLGQIWRHACDLTQDATPLINFMLANEDLDSAVRAKLIAQTLLDDVTVARVVIRQCSEFIATIVAAYSRRLSLIRAESGERHWLIEAQWMADSTSKSRELHLITTLLRTLTSGISVASRETLADFLRRSGGSIGEAIADQAKIGGTVTESVDLDSGRVILRREWLES